MKQANKYSKFVKGGGLFICEDCGKRTRKTNASNVGDVMCDKCIELGEHRNSISDNEEFWDKETLEQAEKDLEMLEKEYYKRKNRR